MITGVIKNKIDKIWTDIWAGGITNPLTVIEQLTYLMFIRSLDEKEIETEEEMKYALLFGLKECPYPMYSCFVMQNIEADHGVSRGSGLY